MTSKIDLDMTSDLTGEIVTANNTDRNLIAEIGDDLTGWVVASLPYMRDDGFRAGGCMQVVYHAEGGRAGMTYVGSGSSGATIWTDANSLGDAFRRFVEDDICE